MMQPASSQVSYWNRIASKKRFSHPLRLDWLTRYSDKHARILDYGCGYGRTLAELLRAGFTNLVGVDFSERMLARARVEVPGPGLIRNDGRNLAFRDDCFEVVLLFAVLTCIPNDDEQRRLVSEVGRVLQPGGLIYVSDLLVNNDARNLERYEQYAESHGCYGVFELPEGVVVRHHEQKWIEEITSGFEKLELEPFIVTTMNGNASSAFQYLGRKPRFRKANC
jgi:SAM-dependent methyltransferase